MHTIAKAAKVTELTQRTESFTEWTVAGHRPSGVAAKARGVGGGAPTQGKK